eukprot:Gb_19827 [translate_table: standard]
MIQKDMNQTFTNTAYLANLLPTCTVLAFQILCPIFSNNDQYDVVSHFLTILVVLCGISCFVVCFTDRFRAADGNVYYRIASPRGLWTFEYV